MDKEKQSLAQDKLQEQKDQTKFPSSTSASAAARSFPNSPSPEPPVIATSSSLSSLNQRSSSSRAPLRKPPRKLATAPVTSTSTSTGTGTNNNNINDNAVGANSNYVRSITLTRLPNNNNNNNLKQNLLGSNATSKPMNNGKQQQQQLSETSSLVSGAGGGPGYGGAMCQLNYDSIGPGNASGDDLDYEHGKIDKDLTSDEGHSKSYFNQGDLGSQDFNTINIEEDFLNLGPDYQLPPPQQASTSPSLTYPVRPHRVPIRHFIAYYLPIFSWLPYYNGQKFLGDIIAGCSLASFQIPLSLSYATSLAHVPTVCGLYGLIVPPIVYCIFGSVPQMIVGPEGAISLVVGQAVEPILKHARGQANTIGGGDSDYVHVDGKDLVVIISEISGGALLGCGLLRFGFLENVLNGALLSGFISAVGLVMILNGLIDEMKLHEVYQSLPGHQHSPVDKLRFVVTHYQELHGPTFALSAVTFAVIFGLRMAKKHVQANKSHLYSNSKIAKKLAIFFPEILFTVIVTICVSWYFKFDQLGIEVLGKVKHHHMKLEFPITAWQKYHGKLFFQSLVSAGYVTAILGFFESATASKSLGSQFDIPVSSNRELVALGAINVLGSCFCALPSFGGYGRSKVNAVSGAQTTMLGAVMGLVTLLMTIYLLPFLYYLPKCLLSVISTVIGVSLLEEAPLNLRFHWHARGYNELVTFCITIMATFFSLIELGISVGVGYSLLRVIKHSAKSRIQILARVALTNEFINADEVLSNDSVSVSASDPETNIHKALVNPQANPQATNRQQPPPLLEEIEGCLIIKIPEPLTFTNANDLKTRIRRLETYGSAKTHPAAQRTRAVGMARHIVIDLQGMTSIDSLAAQILLQILASYKRRKIRVYLCRLSDSGGAAGGNGNGNGKEVVAARMAAVGILAMAETNLKNGIQMFSSLEEALEQVDAVEREAVANCSGSGHGHGFEQESTIEQILLFSRVL